MERSCSNVTSVTVATSLAHRIAGIFLLCCLAFLPLSRAQAQTGPIAQYKLEAVFLFNFVQFIEWPSTAFPSADAPFTIGILGKDPFGSLLDETVRGESIKGRPLRVERYSKVEEIKNCQILYISSSEGARLEEIFKYLKGKPILSVGETEGFARKGVAVRFLTEQPKIRLRINVDTLAESKLTASSKLLRLAELVHTGAK